MSAAWPRVGPGAGHPCSPAPELCPGYTALYRSAVMVVKYLYQTYSSYTAGLCARNNKFIYRTIKYIRILSCITS